MVDTIDDKIKTASIDSQNSKGIWNAALWNEDEYPQLTNDSHLYDKVMKIFNEINNTDRNTVARPEKVAICMNNKSFSAQLQVPNIIPNIGLNEMGKRSISGGGGSVSKNVAHAIGTDATTPTLADTLLTAEIFRKVIGTQQVVNQTEQYATAYTGSEIPSPPQNIREAGIFTVLTANTPIIIAHVTFSTFILDVGKIFTLLTNITHKNGTAV